MILRALPHTPGHDGVRLFLPAFGAARALGWARRPFLDRPVGPLGAAGHRRGLARGDRQHRGDDARAALVLSAPLVGGLPGATALGMEPTYYWDALSPEARRWLFEHTKPPETIQFATFPHSWLYLRTDRRTAGASGPDRSRPAEMVRASKQAGGFLCPLDRALAAHGHAAYTVTKLGVPLDLDLSHQRSRARERPSPPMRREHSDRAQGTQRRRPTGLLRKQDDPHDHA